MGVDTDVEQASAAQLGIEKAALRIDTGLEAEIGLYHVCLTDSIFSEKLSNLDHDGEVAGPHGLHQKDLTPAGGVDYFPCFLRIDCEGLLAENGNTGLYAHERILFVQIVRRGDVDGVDLRIG